MATPLLRGCCVRCDFIRRVAPAGCDLEQAPHPGRKNKPPWPNTNRHSTTSVYSSMGPPARAGCPSSSLPTTANQVPAKPGSRLTRLFSTGHCIARKKKSKGLPGTAVPCDVLAFMWHLPPVARRRQRERSAPSPRSSMTAPPVSGSISYDEICRDMQGFREVIGHPWRRIFSRSLIVTIAFPIGRHTIGH